MVVLKLKFEDQSTTDTSPRVGMDTLGVRKIQFNPGIPFEPIRKRAKTGLGFHIPQFLRTDYPKNLIPPGISKCVYN